MSGLRRRAPTTRIRRAVRETRGADQACVIGTTAAAGRRLPGRAKPRTHADHGRMLLRALNLDRHAIVALPYPLVTPVRRAHLGDPACHTVERSYEQAMEHTALLPAYSRAYQPYWYGRITANVLRTEAHHTGWPLGVSDQGFSTPSPFLEFRVDRLDLSPPLIGACVGYEMKAWRQGGLAKHLMQWLPEFALSYSECADLDTGTAVRRVGEAAASIYTSEKYQRRGEFGEVLLHAIVRQRYKSIPLISKIYFKDSPNDTAKGFDAVHVVEGVDGLELWLGEAKFYSDISKAIAEAVESLEAHFASDFLRREFLAIRRKIDPNQPLPEGALNFFEPNLSLDRIVKSIHVPVLLTYDSEAVAGHDEVNSAYISAFEAEVLVHQKTFCEKSLPKQSVIHLLLLPLLNKGELVAEMDRLLKAAQEFA
jgi:hypothetical protein